MNIDSHGIWIDSKVHHYFDFQLADALCLFVSSATITDLGCGQKGSYVKHLLVKNIQATGYDGNPQTEITTEGRCKVADLAIPQEFPITDWVMCLEVAEHIPKKYQSVFLDNLSYNRLGIILSWATPKQGGRGHVNSKTPEQVIDIMAERGYVLSAADTYSLRKSAKLDWFKKNISVFRRTHGQDD